MWWIFMHLNIFEVLLSTIVIILLDAQIFLSLIPVFFFLSFMIPFLPFSLLYLPNVTYELSITQLAFAPNCLFTPLTPERRVFEWTKYKLYSALCQL